MAMLYCFLQTTLLTIWYLFHISCQCYVHIWKLPNTISELVVLENFEKLFEWQWYRPQGHKGKRQGRKAQGRPKVPPNLAPDKRGPRVDLYLCFQIGVVRHRIKAEHWTKSIQYNEKSGFFLLQPSSPKRCKVWSRNFGSSWKQNM